MAQIDVEELHLKVAAASNDKDIRTLIKDYKLDLETLELLKSHSAQYYFDQPFEAVRISESAYRLGDQLPQPGPAYGRWILGNALLFVDQYQKATSLFDDARELLLSQDLDLDAARMGVGQVWALAYSGQAELAVRLSEEIKPLLSSSGESVDYRRLGGLYNNLGIAYEILGDYERALSAYDQKLDVVKSLEDAMGEARTEQNRGCALSGLNAYPEAQQAFQAAEEGFRATDAVADLARVALNQGILYTSWGRFDDADAAFTQARRHLSQIEGMTQQNHALAVYQALARLRGKRDLDPEHMEHLQAARVAFHLHGPPSEEALAWLALGYASLGLGDNTEAEAAFTAAHDVVGSGAPLSYLALFALAEAALAQGRAADAESMYLKSLDEIESSRIELRADVFRAGFLADKLEVYEGLSLFYLRQGQTAAALDTAERAQSRLLVERLVDRLETDSRTACQSDSSDVGRLCEQLSQALDQLSTLRRKLRTTETTERGEVWTLAPSSPSWKRLTGQEQVIRDLIRSVQQQQSTFSPWAAGYTASLKAVQAGLGSDVLLRYIVAGDQVWGIVINAEGILSCQNLGPVSDIDQTRKRFTAAVERILGLTTQYGNRVVDRYLGNLQADADRWLTTLYAMLLEPLADVLPENATLIVVPDGPLHYVPFHALRHPTLEYYVIQQHAVAYAPSLTAEQLCSGAAARGEGILIVGPSADGLHHVREEVDALQRLYPQATSLLDTDATVARVKAAAPGHHMMHLATHAHFRSDDVMLSGLSLADRPLTLAEAAMLDLDADLVTLSACDTGRGQLLGADLVSLSTSFLAAGARTVLVSLWRVDDATTARLMEIFHKALAMDGDRAKALQKAQLTLLESETDDAWPSERLRHPAYWAPFVLIGARAGLQHRQTQLDQV